MEGLVEATEVIAIAKVLVTEALPVGLELGVGLVAFEEHALVILAAGELEGDLVKLFAPALATVSWCQVGAPEGGDVVEIGVVGGEDWLKVGLIGEATHAHGANNFTIFIQQHPKAATVAGGILIIGGVLGGGLAEAVEVGVPGGVIIEPVGLLDGLQAEGAGGGCQRYFMGAEHFEW